MEGRLLSVRTAGQHTEEEIVKASTLKINTQMLCPIFSVKNAGSDFSLIEKKTSSGFFHASKNNARVWVKPRMVSRFRDINSIIEYLKAVDTLEYAKQQRPNTKWTVHSVASTTFC